MAKKMPMKSKKKPMPPKAPPTKGDMPKRNLAKKIGDKVIG